MLNAINAAIKNISENPVTAQTWEDFKPLRTKFFTALINCKTAFFNDIKNLDKLEEFSKAKAIQFQEAEKKIIETMARQENV
jgi:hypothetical protein